MAPTAIQTTSELTDTAVDHALSKSAPSIARNGTESSLAELDASRIMFTRNTNPQKVPEPNSPEVWAQNCCTDHMITCQWTSKTGWATPRCEPYGPLTLMPTASVLHYATECFEGLKFFRGYDLKLRLFRPDWNARRMLNSATRIALPAFDPTQLRKLIETLVAVDGEKWLPKSRPGAFVYLRPTMIANGAALGVQKPKEALLFIIANMMPSFDTALGTAPVDSANHTARAKERLGMTLLASSENTVRAWPGGFGFAKVGANYGPTLMAQDEARSRGFDQVLWLLGSECEVTEAGASNFFVVWKTRDGQTQLVTAPLADKIILDGVTRGSIIELAAERLNGQLEIVERKYTMNEVEEAADEGRLLEAFAAGTAFFVAPVCRIHFRGKDLEVPTEGLAGKYTALIKQWLKNIMYGDEEHPWASVVNERQLDGRTNG